MMIHSYRLRETLDTHFYPKGVIPIYDFVFDHNKEDRTLMNSCSCTKGVQLGTETAS